VSSELIIDSIIQFIVRVIYNYSRFYRAYFLVEIIRKEKMSEVKEKIAILLIINLLILAARYGSRNGNLKENYGTRDTSI
jgi:hypothetical protein